MKAEARKAPTGTIWSYIRSYVSAGRYRVVCVRSDAGATKYISEDEWEDWELA